MTRKGIIEGLKLLEDNMVYFDELLNDKGKWIDVHELLFEAIEVLEQEPKWILVSERLPEEKQSVLVWCPLYKNIYCAYLEKGQWWIFGAFVQIVPNEVVAWMPLPKSYKAESEEKE